MVSGLERVKLLHGIDRTCRPVKNMSNEHLLATIVVHGKEYIFHIRQNKLCLFPVTRPTLIFGPDPKVFIALDDKMR